MIKILLVAGARPNFMKIAPLLRVIHKQYEGKVHPILVHTGQHYDPEMSQTFFDELEISNPDYYLGIGSGSHAVQTAKIMIAFEEVCLLERPEVVVVVGDVNSTIACALVAKKLEILVAHVEAGLRSRDLSMPEEINRMVTDTLSDFLFVTEKSGISNLIQEGKAAESIHFVGNVMVDTLFFYLPRTNILVDAVRKPSGPFAVLTLHRPSNVDDPVKLREIIAAIATVSQEYQVYFPAHPRTRRALQATGLLEELDRQNVIIMPPLAYLTFLSLWKDAALVLTDSGGLQEETTALGIPCITIRENTERPITIEEGTNTLAGASYSGILAAYDSFKDSGGKKGRIPELWDGKAAERIVAILAKYLCTHQG